MASDLTQVNPPVAGVPHPNEYPAIDGIVEKFCVWRHSFGSPQEQSNRGVLERAVYDFHTDNFLTKPVVQYLYRGNPTEDELSRINTIWDQFKELGSDLDQKAKSLKYTIADNPRWHAYQKPSKALPTRVNFKFYLTISNGWNLGTFLDNMYFMQGLLDGIAKAKTQGSVSVKLAVPMLMNLAHKDNVVIHFSRAEDAAAIWSAVKASGLTLYPRHLLRRTEWGYDMGKSDATLVSEYFPDLARRFIRPHMCPPNNLTSEDRQLVFDALVQSVLTAPHRAGINFQYR